jgi:2,5-diketo-D-gluconate reductase B
MITSGGLRMPKLGLGTWQMSGAACVQAVQSALAKGYRHIDTAEMYNNEEAVGEALAAGSVPRSDIHVTSKVWHEHLAPDAMRRAIETSLRKLRTDYLDLYLIHWPSPSMDLPKSIETLVSLKEAGQARRIGVSNFPVALMRRAVEEIGAPIVCNQVEYHLFLDQSKVLDYARANGIAVTAYCPLARGKLGEHPEIADIARKHGASPQQVALKWLLDQDGVSAIPKAARDASQQANWDAQSLTLDDEDRAIIARLTKSERIVDPAFAPAWDSTALGRAA